MQSVWCFSAIFPIHDGENGNGKTASTHHILACDALRNDRTLDETKSLRGATTQLLTNLSASSRATPSKTTQWLTNVSACLNRASMRF